MPRNPDATQVRDFEQEQDDPTQEPISELQMDTYVAGAREMIVLKKNKAALEAREKELKEVLMEMLDRLGRPYGSDGQHLTIDFPTQIRGFARFVRRVSVSQTVDEMTAEAIARDHGLYDRLFKPVMQLDEDAVLVARQQGLLTDEELERMFPKKRVYSLVPEKAK
jgi:uncharacterized protein YicC (UPF0701 family)